MTEGPEREVVEKPFIDQLVAMGWQHLPGEEEQLTTDERSSHTEVLLEARIADAIRRVNPEAAKEGWLDETRIAQAINQLRRPGPRTLFEVNQATTELLRKGATVEGPDQRNRPLHFIDWDDVSNNEFLVIDQLRVRPKHATDARSLVIPDLTLFVNGIPLVVVECKDPGATDPIQAAIGQLRRYANRREHIQEPEGVEQLFRTNQFTIATCLERAKAGTFTARAKHYMAWRTTHPKDDGEVAAELGVSEMTQQHRLVAGMLDPEHLLEIIRHFTLWLDGSTKIVCRYQQFEAVQKAIQRLQEGATREEDGEVDKRGGIVWHTQGSGKSLTMVFLVRKLRAVENLKRFKIVVVTDRTDLQKQLRETAEHMGDHVETAGSIADLKRELSQEGAGVVFGTIQKFREDEMTGQEWPVLNESEDILVLADEAHRSHTRSLHANLMKALPNCAKIGFTGTPILKEDKKETTEVFGRFLDKYTIRQSQKDGTTVPILYEGRPVHANIEDETLLDQVFEVDFAEYTEEEIEAIKRRHVTDRAVLEAEDLVRAKAGDMLRHYVSNAMLNGHKAQVVGVSREAAVRYQAALEDARDELVEELEARQRELAAIDQEAIEEAPEEIRFLARALPEIGRIRSLEFAAIISGDQEDPDAWKSWTSEGRQESYIERFKEPLDEDPLCMLCVCSMLLTGFDAPVEQTMYLDTPIREHTLLQAIARVNRPYPRKERGLVVDYYGNAHHLKEALEIYSRADLEGAWQSIKDELPRLRQAHRRAVRFFTSRDIEIDDTEACIQALKDADARSSFKNKLREFLNQLDVVLPRPEALDYVDDARALGYIRKRAELRYRDQELSIEDAGEKVRLIIDEHIQAQGIEPSIPPIDILDDGFDEHVRQQGSPEAQAAEMEHAARYHINTHYDEDPVFYAKLSDKLEEIIERYEGRWDALIVHLEDVIQRARDGRPQQNEHVPEEVAPFLSVIARATGRDDEDIPDDEMQELAEITIDLVESIKAEVQKVDFWKKPVEQQTLRNRIARKLSEEDVLPVNRVKGAADELVQLARNRHARLVE